MINWPLLHYPSAREYGATKRRERDKICILLIPFLTLALTFLCFSLKWYKDEKEFYSYVPRLKGSPKRFYPVKGLTVDVSMGSRDPFNLSKQEPNDCEIVLTKNNIETLPLLPVLLVLYLLIGHQWPDKISFVPKNYEMEDDEARLCSCSYCKASTGAVRTVPTEYVHYGP